MHVVVLWYGEVSMVRLRPVWMTNHPPSVLWHCWLGHRTCKNRRPYNLYCVGADVKPCSINQINHSVNLIVFTLLLVHFILRISPHHSHHLRSHHLSLPRPFTSDLKLISFTNPFLHSHSYSFRTAFTDLNLYWIKGALALFVLVSGYVC